MTSGLLMSNSLLAGLAGGNWPFSPVLGGVVERVGGPWALSFVGGGWLGAPPADLQAGTQRGALDWTGGSTQLPGQRRCWRYPPSVNGPEAGQRAAGGSITGEYSDHQLLPPLQVQLEVGEALQRWVWRVTR